MSVALQNDSTGINGQYEDFKKNLKGEILSDTEAALLYLRQCFPAANNRRYPPIHFLHQVYSILKNKTKVDKEANDLQQKGKIIFFKLGLDEDNTAEVIIFTDDVKKHLLNHTDSKIVVKFVEKILPNIRNVFVDAEYLKANFSITEANISELIQEGVLVIRDVGSYWLSFPKAGEFVKAYSIGRREILKAIKRSKYSEILERELKKRKLSKKATLGISYHIADVIGSEDVKCIPTTSGRLLRKDS